MDIFSDEKKSVEGILRVEGTFIEDDNFAR